VVGLEDRRALHAARQDQAQHAVRVREFADEIAEPIDPLGIIVTKYQANSTVHGNVLRNLRDAKDAPVFDTIIPQANDIAAAAEHSTYRRTLKQKYGYRGLADSYRALAKEVLEKLEG